MHNYEAYTNEGKCGNKTKRTHKYEDNKYEYNTKTIRSMCTTKYEIYRKYHIILTMYHIYHITHMSYIILVLYYGKEHTYNSHIHTSRLCIYLGIL